MARENQSIAKDIIDITAKLPWWVGGVLSGISYLWLHSIALKGMPKASGTDLTGAMQGSLVYMFATFGQYIFPFIFGLGALLSVFSALKRKKLHKDVTVGRQSIENISWQEFEMLIGEHFRREGFSVQETQKGPDGGIDLILHKNSSTYVVQCKHYKAYKVGVKPVREMLGVMASIGAAGGYVVTSGQFTGDAVAFSRENRIELIDGKALQKILRAKTESSQGGQAFSTDTVDRNLDCSDTKAVVCQKCGSPLVIKVARKGSRTGQKFYGCTKYPECRFTMSVD